MSRNFRTFQLANLLTILALFFASPASAQVVTGTPPFGSFAGGPEVINLGNLNARWAIPVLHKPGRGVNFTYDLNYNSSVWYPVAVGGNQTWQPVGNWGWAAATSQVLTGQISFSLISTSSTQVYCGPGIGYVTNYTYTYGNWAFLDPFGLTHAFSGTTQLYSPMGCNLNSSGGSGFGATATDGSGYQINAYANCPTSTSCSAVSNDGTVFYPTGGSGGNKTQRNGNLITVDASGHFYDTLSSTTPVLTVAGTAPANTTFTYTAPSGAGASYTMSYLAYTVATNFAINGIVEYGAHAANLVDKITLPDGSFYQFSYEPTPSTPSNHACTPLSGTYQTNCVTARVVKVTLPTGGYIAYSYSGGAGTNGSGIFADGSAATLQRTINDGATSNAWTYARSQILGPEWTTTVSDPTTPTANQTLIYFQKDSATTNNTNNFYETQRQVYQGSTSGTLLRQWMTCYNGNGTQSTCATTAVSSPITKRYLTDQYGSNGLQCEHYYFYNSVGGLSEQDDYDYGPSGQGGSLLRKLLIAYASLGNNITAFKQTVTICNGTGSSSSCAGPSGGNTGTVLSQTNYNYDEPNTLSTVSPAVVQHTSVSGSRGNLTSINYPVSGLTAHFTYWDTGGIKTSQDVNSATTTYNYDSTNNNYCQMGFPTGITEAISALTQSYAWNCTGGVQLTVKDENSNTTTTDYTDAFFWRPADVKYSDGGETDFSYTQTSLQTSTKMNSSQNIVSTVLLDGLGRTKQTQLNSDPQGVDYTVLTYDAVGRPYQAYNPTRCSTPTTNCGEATWGYTATTYDPLNRPTQVTLQDGSVVGASYTNNTVTTTDPAGKARQSTTDSLGRLTQVNEDPSGLNYATTYAYDALGNLTNVTQNGGRLRAFAYDAMSRLTSETNPETATITYKYDSDSNCASPNSSTGDLISRTDARNIRTCYQYDTLHRLTQKNYSDGTTLTAYFAYDQTSAWGSTLTNPIGRLTEEWTGTSCCATGGAAIFGYDPVGRVALNTQYTPAMSYRAVNYTYDLAGDTATYTDGVGETFTQTLNSAGRVTQVNSSWVDSQHPATLFTADATYGYFPHGALRKGGLGNGLTMTNVFNSNLQPCLIDANNNGTTLQTCNDSTPSGNVLDFWMGYNAGSSNNGNVVNWNATGAQSFVRTFSYDSLNRLAQMQETTGSAEGCKPSSSSSNPYAMTLGYDAWGNRTSQNPSSGTCSFSQSVNTQNQLFGSPYQYDAAGNMINDGSHAYFYDAENRLVQVDGTFGTCSTATACYTYDGLGRRVQKSVGSSQTEYIYDLNGQVITEVSPTTWLNVYLRLNGQLFAQYTVGPPRTQFIHTDHLGSARLVTAFVPGTPPTYSVYDSMDYLPFGEQLAGASSTTHKFTGDERDSETNLDRTWFRQYSSQLGRWMHPDPAGLAAVDPSNPQSWNRYAYVLNNPLALVDPLGLNDCPDGKDTCGDDPSCPDCGAPGVDLFGGMNLFPDEGSDRSFWDGSTIPLCLCKDGIIMGNDIFDAVIGTPGTYLTLNMRGQQGFGFSVDLWRTTWQWIDGARSVLGTSPGSLTPVTTGYQVYAQSTGTFTLVSGFIPDLATAVNQGARSAGAPPLAPAELESALTFKADMLAAGIPYDLAVAWMYVAYPEVRDYVQSLANWLGVYTQPAQAVFQHYPGMIH